MINLLLAWLKDVYQRYGYMAVLICVAVVVALFVGVCWIFDIAPAALWKALGG